MAFVLMAVVSNRAVRSFAFLGLDLPQVELQFFSLQNIAISSTTLSRSGRNACWENTKREEKEKSLFNTPPYRTGV